MIIEFLDLSATVLTVSAAAAIVAIVVSLNAKFEY